MHSRKRVAEHAVNRRMEGANSVCDGSVEEEDGCKGLWRVAQKKEEMLQRRSRWRKSDLQGRCSAETMEKQRERERESDTDPYFYYYAVSLVSV